MKASAIANANIALIKYWGKRDERLMLPHNSSISMTIDGLHSHTTVEFDERYEEDVFILNEKEFKKGSKEYDEYISVFLNLTREMEKTSLSAKIVSQNNFPIAAGLASSASGFAALATAVNEALNLDLDKKGLSMLARRGSGSATRSIHGGFVEWKRGEKKDGSDSFAEQIVKIDHWPDFRMIVCITSTKEKKVKSRAGMAQTVETSPLYESWLKTVDEDLKKVRDGIMNKDFSLVGKTAEENCLKMHDTMRTTNPPIIYWNEITKKIMISVSNWRKRGLECYFTIDAGPQVKIICLEKDVKDLLKKCDTLEGIEDLIIVKPGEKSRVTDNHLF